MYLFLRHFNIRTIVVSPCVWRLLCGVCRPSFCTSSDAKSFWLGGRSVLMTISSVERIPGGAVLTSGILTLHGFLFKIQNTRKFSFRDELPWWDEVLCLNRREEKWRSRRQVAVRKEEVFVLETAWRKITLHSVLKSSYLPSVSPLACSCLSLVSACFPQHLVSILIVQWSLCVPPV